MKWWKVVILIIFWDIARAIITAFYTAYLIN